MGVTSRCLDFKSSIIDGQQRDIKGTTTKIVDDDLALSPGAVESVRDGRGGRLVHDTNDVQPCDDTGVFGGLSLVIVEISWAIENWN